jgi:hypothetical protein
VAAPVEVAADSGHLVAADPGAAVPVDRLADGRAAQARCPTSMRS